MGEVLPQNVNVAHVSGAGCERLTSIPNPALVP
eukprot:COSAG01_NODE_12560_length_1719_cov_2.003704_1_plen_32_part_10